MRHSSEPASSEAGLIEFPRQLKVLIVEDDFGDYDAVARALRKIEQFEVSAVRAKTLEAARLLISEHTFDVMLIDYNLGTESGARLLKEIGGRGSRSVAILLTGLIDRGVHEIALQAGAIGCINKSDLSPTLLETTIRSALYTHRLEAEVSSLLWALASESVGTQGHPISAATLATLQRAPWLVNTLRSKAAT